MDRRCLCQHGARPAWEFIRAQAGRNRTEAIALVKLLEQQGNRLRRPQSGALGDGLFELRGKEVRLFYMFLPERVAVLLDGELKKRNDVPRRTLERVRAYQAEVRSRGSASKGKRSGDE